MESPVRTFVTLYWIGDENEMWIVAGSTIENWVQEFVNHEEALQFYDACRLEPNETVYIAEVKDSKHREYVPSNDRIVPIPKEQIEIQMKAYHESIEEVMNEENPIFKKIVQSP